ncbi:hypothetical protein F5880DRAFT_1505307 [Lentinula raphanica]|nr:hypothetical protein F5880DRAFT_1505307 [Lentinula raphanica]
MPFPNSPSRVKSQGPQVGAPNRLHFLTLAIAEQEAVKDIIMLIPGRCIIKLSQMVNDMGTIISFPVQAWVLVGLSSFWYIVTLGWKALPFIAGTDSVLKFER